MHTSERLVQTRIPVALDRRLVLLVRERLISKSAFLRQLIDEAVRRAAPTDKRRRSKRP